jgi:transcriptional regulator with XRE-family HTH domain
MSSTDQTPKARLLTTEELAAFISLSREMRHWSQEQLAAISGLNVRTIQRVERGLSVNLDTRRALALDFEFEDIDIFSKPLIIPSEEELKAAQEKFDRNHVTLSATPLTTGKQLAKLAALCMADVSEPSFELAHEAEESFAALVDYLREYRDCADLYTEVQKREVYTEMQVYIDTLKAQGVALCYAQRNVQVRLGVDPDSNSMPIDLLYLVGFPLGEEPEEFAVPRSFGNHRL